MVRKSKQAGGHMPLTHYERTKKFKSSEYGTTTMRLSGDTHQTFGHCALSLTPIMDDTPPATDSKKKADGEEDIITTIAMVTPSGHLYSKTAIYEYLLTKTQEYQAQQTAYEQQQAADNDPAQAQAASKRQREDDFARSQQLPQSKQRKVAPQEGLKRTSYWLPDSQPDQVNAVLKPPERPASPHSGNPLRKKDLRPVALPRHFNSEDVICAVSGKAIRNQPAVAYWTTKKSSKKDDDNNNSPGVVCLKSVYNMTIVGDDKKQQSQQQDKKKKAPPLLCPLTNAKIRHTLDLVSGGSGFAAHNQVEVKMYRPTIT